MKNIFKIFKNDITGIRKSVLTIILAVGLCVLPALYAWFNIFANWDPYANTGNINIAVVNLDKGYTDDDGNTVNMGQAVADKLKDQTSIGWVFPASKDEAVEGVRSGTYYAAVVIDEYFSYNMYNALTDNFTNPSFTYYENEKKNAVAPKITDTAVSTLKTSINETYIKAISEELISAIDDSDSDLKAKLTGDDLVTALQKVDGNLSEYQKTINSVIKANSKIKASTKIQDATSKADNIISSANSTIDASINSIDAAGSTYYTLRDNLQTQLDNISGNVQSLEESVKLAKVKGDADTLAADLKNIKANADKLKKELDGVHDFVISLDVTKETNIADVVNLISNLQVELDVVSSLSLDTIDDIDLSGLDNVSQQLSEKLTSLEDAISSVGTSFNQKLIPDLDNIMLNVKESLQNTQSLLDTLQKTIASTASVFDNYKNTLDPLDTSLTELSDLITKIREKLAAAIDDVHNVSDSELMDMIMAFLNGDSEALASFLSKPVAVEEQYFYKIANYGSSMAPFYSILAIWVGMTILVSLMKTHVNDEAFKDAKPHELFFGRYLIFFLLSQIQVLVIVLGDLYILKIQCLHPFAFWAVGALAGLTFSIFIYSLTISFGDIGKALAVVIMVLQIAGSGGTYPIEALPNFFRQIYVFFPFPYAINAMRECIGGMYKNNLLIYMLQLSLFIVIALVIGLIIRRPFIRIVHYIEKRMEDTEMM